MRNVFVLNTALNRLEVVDAINEQLMKAKSLTSLLLAGNFSGDVSFSLVYGYISVLDSYLEELDSLFTQLDKTATS